MLTFAPLVSAFFTPSNSPFSALLESTNRLNEQERETAISERVASVEGRSDSGTGVNARKGRGECIRNCSHSYVEQKNRGKREEASNGMEAYENLGKVEALVSHLRRLWSFCVRVCLAVAIDADTPKI
jgi:hypothetical protein